MTKLRKALAASAATSAIAAALFGAGTAMAQGIPANSAAAIADDAEIIVTANKRSERIQDVALSIAAISGAELQRRQVVDLQDLSARVPGLNLQRGGQNGVGQRLIIRGLNTGGQGSTVASVVDDAPLSFSSALSAGADFAADFNPWDLERIEVLRGPQGSLYGATAEGGLIKYVTRAPDTTALDSGFDIGAFQVKGADVGGSAKGYINVPIATDKAAIRVSGYYENGPGWIDNALGGQEAINCFERYGGRAALLLTPTESLTIRLGALYQKLKGDGYDTVEVNGYANPADPFGPLNGFNRDTYVAQPYSTEAQLYSGSIEYDIGGARLQSFTSWGKINTSFVFDNPLYAQLFGGQYFGRPNTTLASGSTSLLKKFNQEFRITSNNDAAATGRGIEWQIGAFYTKETALFENDYLTRDTLSGAVVTTPISPGTAQVFLGTLASDYREIAGFAEVTVHFSPKFDISAGGRVFNNKQNFTQTTGGVLLFPPEFITSGPFKSDETDFTFSVAPRFHFNEDAMVYARVASGYRPGGPNPVVPPLGPAPDFGEAPTTFTSDSTVNYEVGFKMSALDKALSFDVAAFYVDWTDIQVSTTLRRGFTGYNANVNAGAAVSKGFEWSIGLRPTKGLNISWAGAFTDASLSAAVPEINGLEGAQLPFVPKWTTTATADWEFPVTDTVTASIGGSIAVFGERFTNFSFDPTRAYVRLPSYTTLSAQVGLRAGRFGVQLYGKNLGNSFGITNYDPGQLLLAFGPPGLPIPGTATIIRPREIGLRLTGNF